ncbi:hypothetical protein [Hufsiella ginkgonis]|uniref:hypothetical protein n=1 Tax=Hufsiella ginkgonis TaxID=2695274 RepID=UPI001925F36D|nr:hypothetical protein [Hufsiella ginkgonis]
MNVNYLFVGAVAIAVIALLIFLITRNNKDKKRFEMENNKAELKPEKHTGEQI